jgi:hypothetical protein
MTLYRKGNIRLFFLVAGAWLYLLGYGYEADKEDAAAIHSREWVAQQYCGQNAHVEWVDDIPQCYTKHGRKVKNVK